MERSSTLAMGFDRFVWVARPASRTVANSVVPRAARVGERMLAQFANDNGAGQSNPMVLRINVVVRTTASRDTPKSGIALAACAAVRRRVAGVVRS
jgi:hypothetical protein